MVNTSFNPILAKGGVVVRLVDKEPTILRYRDGTIKKVKGNSYGFIKPDGAPDNSTNIYFANIKEGETPFDKNVDTQMGIKIGDHVSMSKVEIDGAFESGQLRYQATGISIDAPAPQAEEPQKIEVEEETVVSDAIINAAFVEMGDIVDIADAQIDESLYGDEYYGDEYEDDEDFYARKQPKRLNSGRRKGGREDE